MTIYRAVEEPPEDNRALLCAWRIEESLSQFDESYDYEPPYDGKLRTGAAATVQFFTGLDRDASLKTLEELNELQAAIATTVAADGKTYEQAYGENVEAYVSELMRLARLGVRS